MKNLIFSSVLSLIVVVVVQDRQDRKGLTDGAAQYLWCN